MSDSDVSTHELMSRSAKYTPIEQGGLEVVPQHEYDAPEVVTGSTLNRRSSLFQPEPYNSVPYYTDKQEHGNYYDGAHAYSPGYEGGTRPSYINPDMKEPGVATNAAYDRRDGRRCCGMRRKYFIILVVTVAPIVVIAAVLGGVLGTTLPEDSNNSGGSDGSSLQTMSGTGLASTLAGDDSERLLTYFQDPDGKIIENSYVDGTWSLEDKNNASISVVTTQATAGSPLAAISYKWNGETYRQIFFITSTGSIMTANSTKTTKGIATAWSIGRPITNDRVAPNSVGLAACYSTDLMNGIRAFYPSQYGYIQEVKWTFGKDSWRLGEQFDQSDTSSGVGCAVKMDSPDQYLNVYMRNSSTKAVTQTYADYHRGDYYWYNSGPSTWRNRSIAVGSDVAVCSDNGQTEYVYYQLDGNLVTRGIVNPSSVTYEVFDKIQGATTGSKLACAFADGGSVLLFQNRSSDSTIYASDVSRYGVSIWNTAVP